MNKTDTPDTSGTEAQINNADVKDNIIQSVRGSIPEIGMRPEIDDLVEKNKEISKAKLREIARLIKDKLKNPDTSLVQRWADISPEIHGAFEEAGILDKKSEGERTGKKIALYEGNAGLNLYALENIFPDKSVKYSFYYSSSTEPNSEKLYTPNNADV